MRWSGLSLLAVTLLLLAAGAGLAFIFGLFNELVDSAGTSNFFQQASRAAPASPLSRFTSRAFLAVVFFLGVLIASSIFSKKKRGHWLGALLLGLLLMLIGTPLAESVNLIKVSPPDRSVGGSGSFLENGLNLHLDMGGVVPSLDNLSVPQIDPSAAPSPGLSPEGSHELLDTPVFRVSGASNIHLLRTLASTTYNGETWTIDNDLKFTALDSPAIPSQVVGFDSVVKNTITLTPTTSFGKGFIPTALNISYLRFTSPLLWNSELTTFQSKEVERGQYSFTASSYTFSNAVLNGLPVVSNSRYLHLPDNISARVRKLAQEVTADAASPYEKAKALEQYLKTTYTYDFGFTNAPQGWEAADWFLFEDRRGVCANFNHAFVVMARSIGLPARPVVGWAIAATDKEQEVTAAQAHQWAEILFEDAGWLTFDSTAPGGAPDRVTSIQEQQATPTPKPTPSPFPTSTPARPTATPSPAPTPTPRGDSLENGLKADLQGGGAVSDLSLSPEGAHQLSEDPVFRVQGASNTRYLRVMASNTYDGSTWQGNFQGGAIPYQGDGSPIAPAAIDQQYLANATSTLITATPLTSFTPGFLPTSLYTTAAQFPIPITYYGSEMLFQSSASFSQPYSWESASPLLSEELLTSAQVVKDAAYLQLPDGVTDRVKELARQITQGLDSPYAQARELERFLKTQYAYDLDFRNAPQGWEAADWFLFEEQRGVCANFNHAFVIMARSIGLPARPVAGWAITPTAQEQVVRAKQAHQWTEILFQGIGWITFDATPPGGPLERTPVEPTPIPTAAPTPGPTSQPLPTPDRTPGPTPSPTPGPGPTPGRVETVTEITSVESFATKGGQFIVKGTVVDSQGRPLDATPVDIFINETKEHGGILLGSGQTEGAVFQIAVEVPTNIPVGEYQVLAHAKPTGEYLDSWSDPPIVIKTQTATTLQVPDKAVVGTTISFIGYLKEEFGAPLAGQRMNLLVDGQLVAITFTSKDGSFSFQHTFTRAGLTRVTAQFPGTDLYLSSEAEQGVQVAISTSLTLSALKNATMNQPALFSGQLLDMYGNPVAGQEVVLSSAGQGEMGRTTTNGTGSFSLEHAFSKGGPLTVRARFAGTDLYLPSSAETSINVLIPTAITLEIPESNEPLLCPDISIVSYREGGIPAPNAAPECPPSTPATVDVEQMSVFSGRLTDTSGQPLPGQLAHLLLNGDSVAVGITDGEGYYQIAYTFQNAQRVTVGASFAGKGLYLPSQAQAVVDVMVPTAIQMVLPEYGLLTSTTTLAGTLQDLRGKPLPGLPVYLAIDDLETQTLTTDANGRFSLKYVFPQPGVYQIQATSLGNRQESTDSRGFLRPAQAQEELPIITVDIAADIPSTLVRGELTVISGRLTLASTPQGGERVTIQWDGRQVAELRSQEDGAFYYALATDPAESLETHLIIMSVPSAQAITQVEVSVKARTSLSVAGATSGHPGDGLTFKETLLDDRGRPIPQATISIDGHSISAGTTDEGIATLSFQIPKDLDVERLSLAFRFEETDIYMGSVAIHRVAITAGGIPLWAIATLVTVAILALGVGFYYWRWWRPRHPGLIPPFWPSPPPVSSQQAMTTLTQGTRRLKTTLYIELPPIEPGLPPVWGLGETLEVHITLRDENQMPVPNRTLSVTLGGEMQNAQTDREGVCTVQHSFDAKGNATIAVRFQEDREYRGTSQEISLRIVDYREEVVQLYNDSLEGLRTRGVRLPRESSPRETEALVRSQQGEATAPAMAQVVESFEVADYSLHNILRDRYVRMYTACIHLTGKGGLVNEPTT